MGKQPPPPNGRWPWLHANPLGDKTSGLPTSTPPSPGIGSQQPMLSSNPRYNLHSDSGQSVATVQARVAVQQSFTDDIVLDVTNKMAAQQAKQDRGRKMRHAGEWVSAARLHIVQGVGGGAHGAWRRHSPLAAAPCHPCSDLFKRFAPPARRKTKNEAHPHAE
jgi:hypothetical protein